MTRENCSESRFWCPETSPAAHMRPLYMQPASIESHWHQCFILAAANVFVCVWMCVRARYTLNNKDSVSHFWTAITVPLRKLSRWVWNMQQFVWSLRCLFRAAFACNYNRIGSVPCYWCILFVLRSNFLFLRGWREKKKKPPSAFFFFFF